MSLSITFGAILLAVACALLSYRLHLSSRRLPPGPKPDPIIGNARHIPRSYSWRYFTELKGKYGDIVYLSAFGQPMIILNSFKAASDLLLKRALIYSDRPRSVMTAEIMGWEKGLLLARYGPTWRIQRKLVNQHLGLKAIREYAQRIETETRKCIGRMHSNSNHFAAEYRLTAIRLILGVTYGLEVDSAEDEFAMLAERANSAAIAALAPGAFLVNLFPILKYIPSWFPGAGFKRQGKYWASLVRKMVYQPYEQVKKEVAAGHATPSLTSHMLENNLLGSEGTNDEAIMWLSGTMYSAGADTTLGMVVRFILVMTLYPEVQRKAQEEIERVIGSERLPSLDDKSKLPYIDCILRELYRWQILVPSGVPHRLTEDDEYEGYFLPKGSIVIPNCWAMSQDSEMYPNPEKFDPERHTHSEDTVRPLDPRSFAFGFGRRICPGRDFAEAVVYTAVVTLLATSNISKAVDQEGNEITPQMDFTGDLLSEAKLFPCRIQARPNITCDLRNSA